MAFPSEAEGNEFDPRGDFNFVIIGMYRFYMKSSTKKSLNWLREKYENIRIV